MSRTKGSTAQAGPPRWRRGPEQDVNAPAHEQPPRGFAQGQAHPSNGYQNGYQDDPYAGQQPPAYPRRQQQPSHFPHEAFRSLGEERHAAALSRPTTLSHNPRANGQAQHPQDPYAAVQSAWPTESDPAGYDLAHYAPDQFAGSRPGHDPYGTPDGYGAHDAAAADGWNGGGWNGQTPFDPNADGYGHAPAGYAGGHPDGEEYYEDGAEAEAHGGRSRRTYMIAGVLIAVIAVGGGLSYAYKSLGRGDGRTPLLRADTAPAKTRPADPGGKELAHTDKKFLNRLGDDRLTAGAAGGAEASSERSASSDSDGGPRKVTTLVVNRDGSMAPPNPVISTPQDSSGSSAGGSGVPGMVVEGLNNGRGRLPLRGSAAASEQQPMAQQQQQTQQQAQQPVVVKPQVISRVSPAEEAPRPVSRKAPERDDAKRPERDDAKRPAPVSRTAMTTSTAASTGNGYVPVLSSQKSRMDALKAFADLQQKHGNVLQGGTPDVREVDLGQKGVWHRLMLGPPGSKEAARTVCNQLKAEGFSGCWVTAY